MSTINTIFRCMEFPDGCIFYGKSWICQIFGDVGNKMGGTFLM